MKTIILIEIDHDKPITDLTDKVAGRAYTLDGVSNATARIADTLTVREVAHFQGVGTPTSALAADGRDC